MPSQGNQKEWEWDPSKSIWVQKCMPDPAMDLNPRVLQSMLRIEEAHAPVNYFTKEHQNDIRPWMRRMVTTWMLEVCEEQKCESYVFALACNLLDRFLSVCRITRTELQLLGSACLLLASKARETVTLTAENLVTYTDDSITIDQLLDMELLLLLKLKWDIMVPTSKDFLTVLLKKLEIEIGFKKEEIKNHANTFIDLIILDDDFLTIPPSLIASCCLVSAIAGNPSWVGTEVEDGAGPTFENIMATLRDSINSDAEYFASLYESVHGSLERTLAGRGGDQSEDENGSDQSETEKKTNSQNNQTPTEISDYDE